ncbi:phage minor head protein [Hydrocarboniphaga effusa]|uniref:phage head morphogenesis protein n=1 Tax=Hydrocarboniphaga effusa TaxID=243629 RepID=UPI003BAA65E3
MTVAADLQLAPEAALKAFRSKGLVTSFSWRDMERDEHDASATVAKMMDMDLLSDTVAAIDRALAKGETLEQFSRALKPRLQEAGWWGQKEMTDPLTGETKLVQLGSSRRLRTIFRTNMQTAYANGAWAQIRDNAKSAPYLMYNAVDDNRTRPEHRAWNGTVLPIDSPWWASHTPPCGYNCRCSVIQMSGRDLKRYGVSVAPEPPPTVMRDVPNPRTGEVVRTPVGVDPGWGYNPTSTSPAAQAAKVFAQRVSGTPAELGARAWHQAAPAAAPALRETFQAFVQQTLASGVARRASAVAGVAAPTDIAFLAAEGIELVSAEIAVGDQLLVGPKAARHAAKGDGLTVADWNSVPDGLAQPMAVLFDTEKRNLLYVMPDASGDRAMKLAVEPNFQTSKPKATLNSVRAAFKIGTDALRDQKRYRVVRGQVE